MYTGLLTSKRLAYLLHVETTVLFNDVQSSNPRDEGLFQGAASAQALLRLSRAYDISGRQVFAEPERTAASFQAFFKDPHAFVHVCSIALDNERMCREGQLTLTSLVLLVLFLALQ